MEVSRKGGNEVERSRKSNVDEKVGGMATGRRAVGRFERWVRVAKK
jgi:hypothetical protein